MSFFGIGQQGITLKELLENPKLQTAPNLKDQSHKNDKSGNGSFDPTSAFLGPNLWSSSSLQDENFQLEYMDLDEFLSENGIPSDLNDNSIGGESDQSQKSPAALINSPPSSPIARTNPMISGPQSPPGDAIKELFNKEPESPEEVPNPTVRSLLTIGHNFDPKRRRFTVEELKPQPIIKKSRKIFVPEDSKDDKYWNRRKKNNVAAKRSRDARRIKENQIAMRASFLESENETMKKQLEKIKKENVNLKRSLSKYESIDLE
ncbi:Hepatic leukemia factor [Mizuhopecten yessoensis]|uniref:Hepatic leukemia factor n=1 Tax=Mizuhopecten yessoensis TaxID=6573 RepID=A0A210Q7Z3_MIZYE|nr:Hepatic leukemia factor [Mizuhopecten yessoensis]